MLFLPATITGPSGWPTIADSNADPDYQLLSDQVYRLEYCFLLRDNDKTYLSEQPWLAASPGIQGLKDVAAIVVSIAILDTKSRTILRSGDIAAASAKLPDVSGLTIQYPPAKLWEDKVRLGDVGLPRAAASQVRVYQRYFYLNN